ncbi:MAG: glycosyl hydrolase 108 family protein [Acetobacteraceae bacterium]|nr:glycosyl hydrolase 108 family protein [Acetobacteraceae bacterium]
MLPLIGLAATFLPELIKLVAGDKAGTIAGTVAQAVTEITGSSDPVAAKQKLDSDPQIAATLQQRLAEIALDATKAQNAEADQQRHDDLDAIKAAVDNTAGARTMMQSLTAAHSPVAYAAPVVSLVVTSGFFIILGMLMVFGLPQSDPNTISIVNLTIGVLGTAFATVVNFWLGSSSSSRDKDAAALQLQNDHASQTSQLLQTLNTSQQSHVAQAQTALQAMQQIATASTGAIPAAVAPAAPSPDRFDSCVAVTLTQEGGFSDNPNDPGGATNFGITLATLQATRGTPVTVDDVRTMTRDEAVEIYRSNHWLPARCGDMPAGVDLMVFDFGVNSGPRTAVKAVQRLVGVKDDGSVGPVTLNALSRADAKTLVNALAQARLEYCRALPTWPDFGTGWTNRVRQVEQAALLMV